MSASGQTQNYGPGNAVDGDANTYWESPNNAFPQWIQVDLGSVRPVKRIVLSLPPNPAWSARTQTLSVLGAAENTPFSPLSAQAAHVFDPATGNSVTLALASGLSARYVRVQFTANTGWPAASSPD